MKSRAVRVGLQPPGW